MTTETTTQPQSMSEVLRAQAETQVKRGDMRMSAGRFYVVVSTRGDEVVVAMVSPWDRRTYISTCHTAHSRKEVLSWPWYGRHKVSRVRPDGRYIITRFMGLTPTVVL